MTGERHARGKDERAAQPSRSQLRRLAVTGAASKRPPGRKDPRLCKAAHWKGPHQPALRVRRFGWPRDAGCAWGVSWLGEDGEPSWQCNHEEYCTGCGKVLRAGIPAGECPPWHPLTGAEREAVEAKRAGYAVLLAAARARNRWKPKPPVTGPQGYRRKREDRDEP